MPRLKRADCSGPGIRRRRRGNGFVYVDVNGDLVEDAETLERIRALAIPPAWADVWICPYANGHLQAIGTDAAGRKQYRYHEQWRARRDAEKFDEMLAFARALPSLRERAAADLGQRELSRERVLAVAVRLLDVGFFRIGGEEYASENQSYGLATMRKRHVKLGENGLITFDFPAKSGKRRVQSIVAPDVYDLVRELKERRGGGDELLAYRVNGGWKDIRSSDINEYIKDATGGDYSSKDFRTWNATLLAAVGLAVSGRAAGSQTARKRAINRTVQEVARYLGNTPAVARASYIDPRVFDRYQAGVTIGGVVDRFGDAVTLGEGERQSVIERAVLDLLEEERSPALEKVA